MFRDLQILLHRLPLQSSEILFAKFPSTQMLNRQAYCSISHKLKYQIILGKEFNHISQCQSQKPISKVLFDLCVLQKDSELCQERQYHTSRIALSTINASMNTTLSVSYYIPIISRCANHKQFPITDGLFSVGNTSNLGG